MERYLVLVVLYLLLLTDFFLLLPVTMYNRRFLVAWSADPPESAPDREGAPREVSEQQRRQIRDTLQRGLMQVNSGAARGREAGAQPLEAM